MAKPAPQLTLQSHWAKQEKVLLFDADLALLTCIFLLGTKPTKSVADFLDKKCSMEESITSFNDHIKIISGGSGFTELLNLDNHRRHQILSGISNLDKTSTI